MSDFSSLSDDAIQSVARRIDYWKSRLLDMSRRNRLLFFKPTRASTAEIMHPSPKDLFDRLVVRGRTQVFPLPDETDTLAEAKPDEESPPPLRAYRPHEIGTRQTDRQMVRILYNLRNRARTAREEQGVNILYLAFGLLTWRETRQGDLVRAPLVLVPVDLTRESPGKPYQLSMLEEDIVVNPTFQAKLRQDFRLELPELPDDLDASGLEQYWQQVDSLVKEYPGWQVEPEVVLGIFNFQNLMIIADLDRNQQALMAHPLIQALSDLDITLPIPEINLIEARELDDRVPPTSTFQVLDADSSQQEAIEAAKAGLSFVLQGPPGTGKSQTIANITAEFLAAGRRVLFVSEKMAALEVVRRRLSQVGLGEFCLEVHSHRRNKREVIQELGQSLKALQVSTPPQLKERLLGLADARSKLNAYVRALHHPRFELGITAFRAYGELARLAGAPHLRFNLPDLEHLASETHQDRLEVVSQLAAYPPVIDQYDHHPWQGCRIENLTLQLREELKETLLNLARDVEAFEAGVRAVAQSYSVAAPRTLQEGAELLRVARVYRPAILTVPVGDIRQRYEKRYQSVFRYLRPNYWRDSSLLRDLSHRAVRPDPRKTLTVLTCAERVQKRLTSQTSPDQALPVNARPDMSQLSKLARRIAAGKRFVAGQFHKEHQPEAIANFYLTEFQAAVVWCLQQVRHIDSLTDWVNFNRVRRNAEAMGLSSFVSQALEAGLKAKYWQEAFLRQFYTLYVDGVVQSDTALQSFQSHAHEGLIERFRQLDREQISLAQRQIRARLAESRPQASWLTAASAEETILRRELNKKRRLKPLRRLFAEIPELVLSLRPCLMMSPLTVSQLLDPELYCFDLVIFDEASQIPPEHAVGSFIRAKQVVVVGDRRQLPPTRFFEALDSDAFYDEEDAPDVFESILNECDAAGLPSKMLLWHYRSRDESLIAFSNYHFYSNRLFTFPAARWETDDTGLEFVYVPDGIYQRGKGARRNTVEAQRVVGLILDHFHTDPELSLGVIAFSQAQRDTIRLELERVRRDHPSLEPFFSDKGEEPFFVKNLELVQGDERDVIIFSVGYGFDETGRFLLNFGPLNREGGERRLNVAVTRSRRRVKLVASIQPEDIDLSRTSSRGAHLLRSYMTVARDGLEALHHEMVLDLEAEFDSPFEASVYEALTNRGLQLLKQVGVSPYRIDLAVVDSEQPGRFLLGIECDGAMYHSAATARDRDRLRQQILEGLGWRVHRIWSRDWIENRKREIEKILAAVVDSYRRRHEPGVTERTDDFPSQSDTTQTDKPNPLEVHPAPKLPPEARPYRQVRLEVRGHGTEDFYRASPSTVTSVLKTVVEDEGPIEVSIAKKRVAGAWQIRRLGRRMQQVLDVAIDTATRQGIVKERGDFLWPTTMETPPVRVPHEGGEPRTVDEITSEELAEGAYLCMKAALSMNEDLIKQTAQLFGLRANSRIAARIKQAIRLLIQTGRLEWRSGKIRLPR